MGRTKHSALGPLEEALRLRDADSAESAVAYDFWFDLVQTVQRQGDAADVRQAPWIEEALVWRVLSYRLLRALAGRTLVVEKEKGAGAGLLVAQPALETLAKLYERWRKVMSELMARFDGERGEVAGLPDIMKPILEEMDGAVEEVLGIGEGAGSRGETGVES